MKKIIDGARYDTDTARLLGERSANITDSLDRIDESLYRTKSGNYFLHGEGGARTQYAAERAGDGFCAGEKIVPLSDEAARKWGEQHMDADLYETTFGSADDATVQRTIRISPAADHRIEDLKLSTGKTTRQIIDAAIMQYRPKDS